MRSAVFAQTLTSGQTLPTSGINLKQIWDSVVVIIPSCPSGSIQFYVSTTETGTYYPMAEQFTSATIASPFTANSGVITGGVAVHIPNHVQFMKIRNTSGCTDAVKTFEIVCCEPY